MTKTDIQKLNEVFFAVDERENPEEEMGTFEYILSIITYFVVFIGSFIAITFF